MMIEVNRNNNQSHRPGPRPWLCGLLATVVLTAMTAALPPSRSLSTNTNLLATYILKPTQIPLLSELSDAQNEWIADPWITATVGSVPLPQAVVDYPASLWPVSGLRAPTFDASIALGVAALQQDLSGDPSPVIFGYSQGATVATVYKRDFNERYADADPGTGPQPTFVLIGNPDRPNGGVLNRFAPGHLPLVDLTFDGATPTQTAGTVAGDVTTYDIARQYDFFADYPTYPLKPLALANACLGLVFEHLFYFTVDMNDAVYQGQYGDTAYYMVPTARLPLLEPLALLGVPDPILAAIDAPLRVLVESGYDRSISPGEPTQARLIPINHPRQTARNFLLAIPTGWDDGLEEVGLGRPFGTDPAGPYGVGGPPISVSSSSQEKSSDSTLNLPAAAAPLDSPRRQQAHPGRPSRPEADRHDLRDVERGTTRPIVHRSVGGSRSAVRSTLLRRHLSAGLNTPVRRERVRTPSGTPPPRQR